MKITKYEIITPKLKNELKIACVSDVHGRLVPAAIQAVKKIEPNIILLAGDILEISVDYMISRNQNALSFLRDMATVAPVYYCFGNHEIYFSHAKRGQQRTSDQKLLNDNIEAVKSLGIHIVNDSYESFSDGLSIGGVICGYDKDPADERVCPNKEVLRKLDALDGFKILLCHYPHYYEQYLKNSSFDLILSGHAHGGQWRIFGRGIYAPHQGLFPKYTSGMYDGRFIISRGAANNVAPIPRIFNPCEVLEITLKPTPNK